MSEGATVSNNLASDAMLSARAIRVTSGRQHRLNGVDIDIRAGRVHALVGPNGSGKSTLLSVLAGDLRPDSGEVLVQGIPWSTYSVAEAARLRALLAQETPLAFPFTVREVIGWGRLPWRGRRGAEAVNSAEPSDDAIINEVIAVHNLGELLDRTVPSLSGGERARVHLARVMAQRTPLLMLDEADAALDLAGQAHLDAAVRRRREQGVAVVVVSHDLSRVAALADEVTLLEHGRVIAQGAAEQMLTAETLSAAYSVPVQEGRIDDLRHFWVRGR